MGYACRLTPQAVDARHNRQARKGLPCLRMFPAHLLPRQYRLRRRIRSCLMILRIHQGSPKNLCP